MVRAAPHRIAREPDAAGAYEALLRRWAPAAEGASLHAAYEFGRDMFGRGLGVLDMISAHNRATAALLAGAAPNDAPRIADIAGRALLESLVPFEMTHRGFREANVALQ